MRPPTYVVSLLEDILHCGLDEFQVAPHGANGVLQRGGEGRPARLGDVAEVGAGLA